MCDEVFYEDAFCSVSDKGITVKKYYFPSAKAKHIPFTQIAGIYYRRQRGLADCLLVKSWGIPYYADIWWAHDCFRKCRRSKYNVAISVMSLTDGEEKKYKGFTVNDVKAFRKALKMADVQAPVTEGMPSFG